MRRELINRQLYKNNAFVFCLLTNNLISYTKHYWVFVNFQSKTLVFNKNMVSLGQSSVVLKLVNCAFNFWTTFWYIVRKVNQFANFFFKEFDLIGLGYRIKRISSSVFRFFWGHANFVYLVLPNSVFAEYYSEERRIILISMDAVAINSILNFFFFLKKPSTYRIVGFVIPEQIVRLKFGKQR